MDTPPGKYKIKVTAKDGEGRLYKSTLWLKVQKADFSTQKITLPSSMVELDPKTLERVNQEAKRLQVLFQGFRNERLWTSPFLRPVKGEISSAFGMRRIINEKPKSPHTGVDLRAEEGTPVLACNSGIVALVDQLFFSGNSVVLDHGWGIYSMYFHLSEALVREGDGVNKGDLLGRVGSTGRSTAPHLHWGVRINGVMVNPLSLLQLTEHLREGSIIQK
jgi:murein DD-endopeptidase MepM/ murein hydrolase activator NlpD